MATVSPKTPSADYAVQVTTPVTQLTPADLQELEAAEERKHVKPTWTLYTSVFLGVILPMQYGWSTSQLNYSLFNNESQCNARPVLEGTCIIFPGHTKMQWTFVVNAWIVGGMFGALGVGRFSDKYGRKRVLQYNCIFMVIGAVIMATVNHLWPFVLGRFVAGIASGATTGTLGAYINEVSPPHLRSMFGVILHSGITIGILLVGTTFFYMDFHNGWRYIALFPVVLAALFLSLSPFVMVESPVWLLLKGRRDEAEDVLTRLFGADNVPTALAWIESKHKLDSDVYSSEGDNESLRDGKKVPYSELLKPTLLRQTIIAVGLACIQKITGINNIFYYSSDMFRKAGLTNARVSTIYIDIVNMVPTLISGFFSTRFGNRNMILFGLIGMLVSAVGITIALTNDISSLTIVFMATYVAAFGVSLGPLLWVVMSDVFPDYARATVTSVAVLVNWFSNLLVGVFYPYISTALGDYCYVPFICLLVVSIFFAYFMIPETSGKTNEEIQQYFRSLRRNKNDSTRR